MNIETVIRRPLSIEILARIQKGRPLRLIHQYLPGATWATIADTIYDAYWPQVAAGGDHAMTRDPAEAHDDSSKCYELALAAIREREIRAGNIQPSTDRPDEIRWAAEGPIEKLETVTRS